MRLHLEQARKNEKFLSFVEDNIKDEFIDWKITVIFYAALHYLKGFFKYKKKVSGFSHAELDQKINPRNPEATLPFPEKYYNSYRELYQNSRNARYQAYSDSDFQLLLLVVTCKNSKENLSVIKNYLKSERLPI